MKIVHQHVDKRGLDDTADGLTKEDKEGQVATFIPVKYCWVVHNFKIWGIVTVT